MQLANGGQDLWAVSVDLTTAFDRIEHLSLLHALVEQGIPTEHVRVFSDYHEQHWSVNSVVLFQITRSIKHVYAVSSFLCSNGVEHVVTWFKD